MKSEAFERLIELDKEVASLLKDAQRRAEDLLRFSEEQKRRILEGAEREVDSTVNKERKRKEEELRELEAELSLRFEGLKKKLEEMQVDSLVDSCLNRIREKVCS